ncbi:MAG: tyrosine-type recombinase/integrase, partial [Deltaproteobacteria bacterium]|nr:tyrosine-type recombinase/integrase [Deltaproteobacteria bacterium]
MAAPRRQDGAAQVPALPRAARALDPLRRRERRSTVFPGKGRATPARIYNQLVGTCARLGQTVFSPHGLRRMIVNRVLRSGMDIKTAAELMGHSPGVMLSHYRRV